MQQIETWRADPKPDAFPFEPVVDRFRSVGKHFVSPDLLGALARVRAELPRHDRGGDLAKFLDTALDKWDNRFDNPSYLAFDLLPLPRNRCPQHAWQQRDRLFVLLLADVLRFELDVLDGVDHTMPQLRPSARVVATRCRLAVRAMRPALARAGVELATGARDPFEAARQACAAVAADSSPDERRTMRLSLLPVSRVHDEYMFARMLQAYETTFALVAVLLSAAIGAVADGREAVAVTMITDAERAMHEAKLVFSIVGTMQEQAFLTFREFTDGASAIQSRNYKLVESLCRRPELHRLESPAYHSVPDVRTRVRARRPTLDEVVKRSHSYGRPVVDVHAAMQRFEAVLLQWRTTHYRLAVRMLGERRGTGYTEGVPYLNDARSIAVFASCPFSQTDAKPQPSNPST